MISIITPKCNANKQANNLFDLNFIWGEGQSCIKITHDKCCRSQSASQDLGLDALQEVEFKTATFSDPNQTNLSQILNLASAIRTGVVRLKNGKLKQVSNV